MSAMLYGIEQRQTPRQRTRRQTRSWHESRPTGKSRIKFNKPATANYDDQAPLTATTRSSEFGSASRHVSQSPIGEPGVARDSSLPTSPCGWCLRSVSRCWSRRSAGLVAGLRLARGSVGGLRAGLDRLTHVADEKSSDYTAIPGSECGPRWTAEPDRPEPPQSKQVSPPQSECA